MQLFIFLIQYFIVAITAKLSEDNITTIFSSTLYQRLDPLSTERYYRSFKIAKQSQLLFVLIGSNTIQIKDVQNEIKLIIEISLDHEINDNFIVTDNGRYLILFDQNKINIYEYNSQKLTNIFRDNQDESLVQTFNLNKKQTKLFICRSYGELQILDLQTKKTVKSLELKPMLYLSLSITEDEKLIQLSDLVGTSLYKVDVQADKLFLKSVVQNTEVTFYQSRLILNDTFIVGLDYWLGISIFDINPLYDHIKSGKSSEFELYALTLNWWMFEYQSPYTIAMEVDLEEQFMYVGSRSQGIFIIDIIDKQKPLVFQQIKFDSDDIFQLGLSLGNKYLFLSTKKSLIVYKRESSNLQNYFPNLYNKHESKLSLTQEKLNFLTSEIINDNNYLFLYCEGSGLIISQINKNNFVSPLSEIQKINDPNSSEINNLLFFCENKYIVLPIQDNDNSSLDVYDVSNISKPTKIQTISTVLSPNVLGMTKNIEETLFAYNTIDRMIIFNINCKGSQLLSQISEYKYPSLIQKPANDILILNGYNYIFLIFKQSHLLLINISNIKTPGLISQINIVGVERIIQGLYNKDYCFLIEWQVGIQIIDLKNLPQINFISSIKLKGIVNHIRFVQNDQFIIASLLSGGQLALIDIRNINQPKLFSQMQFKEENSISTSVTSDLNLIFILTAVGIRVVPLKSNVLLNYEILDVKRLSTGQIIKSKIYDFDQPLIVGQEIQLKLNPLYPIKGSEITNAYYVQDGINNELPEWIKYDSFDKIMTINILKESLKNEKQTDADTTINVNKNTNQIIIFETKFLMNEESFFFEDSQQNVIIDLELSKSLFRIFKEKGIINQNDFISSSFAQNEEFLLPYIETITDENIIALVRHALQKNLVYSPVQLYFSSSLFVDINGQVKKIQSHSQVASITFQINNFDCKFTSKWYSGVSVSISDRQDKIKIEGDIEKLNIILQQNLEIYIKKNQTNNENSTVSLQVNDGINYEYQQTLSLEDLFKLATQKKDILIQSDLNLQEQVNRQFSDSSIDVASSIQIEFSFQTYSNTNFTDLTLQAYMVQSNDTKELILNQYSNIQFLPQQYKFFIKTTLSDYRKVYCFKVNVTDTYSWIEDSFCVKVNGIPFYTFMTIAFQVVGPLVFVIELFCYWNKLFNILYHKKNNIKSKEIRENKKFVQKIIIVNDSYDIGILLFKSFLSDLQGELRSPKRESSQASVDIMSSNSASLIKETYLKSDAVIGSELSDSTEIKIKNKNKDKKLQQLVQNTLSHLRKLSNNVDPKLDFISKYYENNQINIKEFIRDLFNANKKVQFYKKKISPSDLFLELNDQGSVLYNCLKGLLTKELLRRHKRSYLVYKYIKRFCKLNFKCFDSNWQYTITDVSHILKKKKYNQEQIIPNVEIKEDKLLQLLKPLIIQSSQNGFQDNENDMNLKKIEIYLGVDLQLIKNTICEDTIGIINPTKSFLFPNCGESIHVHEHHIKQIKSYISYTSQKQRSIFNVFKSSYVPISLQKNQTLPSWLQIIFEKQLITLIGTPPTSLEDHNIKISIFNHKDCIIREIILKYQINCELQQLDFQDEWINNTTAIIDQSKINSPLSIIPKSFQPYTDQKDEFIDEPNEQDTTEIDITQKSRFNDKRKKSIFLTRNNFTLDQQILTDQNVEQLQRKVIKAQNPLVNNINDQSNNYSTKMLSSFQLISMQQTPKNI